ncbi:PIN domain-containing protein [Ferruginibacter paludis]|uniref:PIN domain-containing protein n=1 Tax=Ferruginibacter paludis TaxID=1310417 RepID=UPI0025B58750|nr:PIN domain-containing protein [Ferruginibacter paludis]MDN3657824.1 PIN domain-containing protein [Ferruginibacter paludis]
MKNLLIDTNSWIDLYTNIAEEKNLEQLLKWEKDGKVKFLLPETLNEEFVRQKSIQLGLLDKKIKDLSNSADEDAKSKLKEAYRVAEGKIEKIETILLRAVKIKNTKKVHEIVGIRYTQKLPPFHKQNSHNDAYIYFATIEYLKKKKIDSFVFITKNVKDFGAPENPNIDIHPGLLIPDIDVQYFAPIALGVSRLQNDLGTDINSESNAAADYTEIFYFFPKDKYDNVVDQVYQVLDIYHDQLPFIPTDFLARIFPFKTLNFRHTEAYHSSFQLNSNNDKLMKFFSSFRIGKANSIHFKTGEHRGNEKKVKEKTLEIIKKLNINLIYDINGIGNNLKSNLQLTHHNECPCIKCTYNRFDIYGAFSLLDKKAQATDHDTLKQAYMFYQFQQYAAGLKLFHIVYENSKKKDQYILKFICLTNLKRLGRLILGHGNGADNESKKIIEAVSKISLRQARLSIPATNPFVNEVIDWIADDNFYSQSLASITSTVDKIHDHYNIQLRGGHSSNSNLDVLISQFAEIDTFLEANFLVYNNYLEFEKVVDRLLEGLFMIYSFNRQQSTRIAFINDYLLSRIIMFAKTENIIKYYNRYNLTSLKYREAPTRNSRLPELALVFFLGLDKLYRSDDYKKATQFLFFDKNRRILNNFLVTLTLAKDVYNFDEILEALLPVLEIKELISRDEVKSLADFISRKGKYISEPLLSKLLKFAIQNKHLHEYNIFYSLSKQLTKNKKNILISETDVFESIRNNFLANCSACDHPHTDVLPHLIPLLNHNFKVEIHRLIAELLQQKFNPDFYYSLAIMGVIDFAPYLDKFKNLCTPPLKRDGPTHPFMRGETVLYRLNELLNIYFKNGLSTKDDFFEKFKGFSDYYDWILDPDGFDYKKFNPLWILEYQTHYYLKRIFKSENMKKHVLPLLKAKKHPVLNNIFIEYS